MKDDVKGHPGHAGKAGHKANNILRLVAWEVTRQCPLNCRHCRASAKNKKYSEEYLLQAQTDDFHVTIIRPSHTYNDKMLISQLKSNKHPFTMINRMVQDKLIIMPDDGMELWTLTYNADFAHAFVDILGNPKTYGEFYHLTSDKVYTWERINEMICEAVGVKPHIIYIPWDFIFTHFPEFKPEIYGDKYTSAVFDNSKIKAVSSHYRCETDYDNIVKKAVKYYLDNEELQIIDEEFDKRYDECILAFQETKK